jgi:hypothetical protein
VERKESPGFRQLPMRQNQRESLSIPRIIPLKFRGLSNCKMQANDVPKLEGEPQSRHLACEELLCSGRDENTGKQTYGRSKESL